MLFFSNLYEKTGTDLPQKSFVLVEFPLQPPFSPCISHSKTLGNADANKVTI